MNSLGFTGRLAASTARHPWLTIIGWIVLLAAAVVSAGTIGDVLTNEDELTVATESIRADDLSDMVVKSTVDAVLRRHDLLPSITVRESNRSGEPGCLWRVAPWKGGPLLLLMNLGKNDARLTLDGKKNDCRDLLTGVPHPLEFTLSPFDFRLLQVRHPDGSVSSDKLSRAR